MDRIEPGHEAQEHDGAEQAFEALREEVTALRRGVELVYRQGQDAKKPTDTGPDYTLTLGAIAKELKGVAARLDAMERAPALATTPARQAAELRRELLHIGQDARGGLVHSQAQLDGTVRELRGMIRSARDKQDQQQWLWTAGACGAMGGVLLWFMLTAMLPWGGGTWLAGLAFGGRWNAGQVMMQDANSAAWNRMVRLYKACPSDSATELCEASLAVGMIPPSRPLPHENRTRQQTP
ncbi:DUF6118 family protein [Acidisoma sp. L85]|jgi:hypothetical protein|uniref:DUF6118 family protein n=1 Tax=Acidisoma sp. L85 TaxID=1641850 RepID=UPI00131A8073|nr:DUF6118 family protein [Acidisoma sp. L85]